MLLVLKAVKGFWKRLAKKMLEELWQCQLTRLEVSHGFGEELKRQPGPRLEPVCGQQRDQHRQGNGNHEIAERDHPDPVHLMMRLQIGHPDDDGGEDQRDQDHPQQSQKSAAHQGAGVEYRGGGFRTLRQDAEQPAQGQAQTGGDKDLAVETRHATTLRG